MGNISVDFHLNENFKVSSLNIQDSETITIRIENPNGNVVTIYFHPNDKERLLKDIYHAVKYAEVI